MATRRPKRPRDPNQLGKLNVDLPTGEAKDTPPTEETAASAFARLGRLMGGVRTSGQSSVSMKENALPETPRRRGGNGNATPPVKEDRFASGYDFLLINHDIDDALFSDVLGCVTDNQKNEKAVVIIITNGGQANVAYRVGRLIQTVYPKGVVAFVPSICKSAGTLIVTAAQSVICMGFGDVGPLDVQVARRDEILVRRSGLTTRSALLDLRDHTFELFDHVMISIIEKSHGSVSFRLAAEIAAKMTSEIMSSIYAQINPEALGQDFMDLSVAEKYCERLNKTFSNLKPGAIHRLVYEYPTHDFVIDFEEAKDIFERVELPTPTLFSLLRARPSDLLRPRLRQHGIIEMLAIPTNANKKSENQDALQTKSNDEGQKPRRHDGGAETPA